MIRVKNNKLFFVCSPFGGKEENLKLARILCHTIIMTGGIPIAPHLLYPQFLADTDEHERRMGIEAGKEILRRCDVILVYTKERWDADNLDACPYISAGMREEIALAVELGIPIKTAHDYGMFIMGWE